MRRFAVIVVLLAAAGAAGYATWWYKFRKVPTNELVLYGNVDLRQVELPFNDNERIATVLVQEGDHLKRGQLLAELDTGLLVPQVNQAQRKWPPSDKWSSDCITAAGPRKLPRRANVAQAAADASNAHVQSDRMRTLSQRSKGEAISQTDVDNARTTAEMADAKLVAQQKALDLLVLGPRKEEIANEAKLQAQEAQYAYLCRQLADAQLKAPMDAVVPTRLMEPGEMASPQKAVFSLAIVDPKWIRAYVSETDLGKVHPGMKGTIAVDSFPDRRFEGWVGFISPIAEFTPKIVQTDELRSTLVYEVRVFVKNSSDDLRLGMPATVFLTPQQNTKSSGTGG